MYEFMCNLLGSKTGGVAFKCFGIWHICYIVFFIAVGIAAHLYLKNKNTKRRSTVIGAFIAIAFGLYMADFFLMPFSQGEISVGKLPFHVCTTMCLMCFLSRRVNFLKKFKFQFATLGFISNLVYLFYPAVLMWDKDHPLSYRVVQTLFFHGIMAVYGFLVLIYERQDFKWKNCYRDLFTIIGMTVWALIGNTFYNNPNKFHNWFFVVQDPFGAIDLSISRYIMPFLNIALFFGVTLLVHLIFSKTTKNVKQNDGN